MLSNVRVFYCFLYFAVEVRFRGEWHCFGIGWWNFKRIFYDNFTGYYDGEWRAIRIGPFCYQRTPY